MNNQSNLLSGGKTDTPGILGGADAHCAGLYFSKRVAHNAWLNSSTTKGVGRGCTIRQALTEQLKENQMEWVGRMNNIRSRATEIVTNDLIYT